MDRETSLSVIVPVFNEQYLVEESLARLRALQEALFLSRVQVIVVDDHSSDDTPASLERFQQAGKAAFSPAKFEWIFLRHERNQGKGAAIRTGLAHADAELVVIHDADLEYNPRDMLRMIPLFLSEEADAVFGSRFLVGEYRRVLYFRHALGNNFLTFLCNLASDLNLSDMETCYKMVRTPLLRSIPLESCDFRFEPEITIKLAKRGARIFEIPISYAGRTYQEGKKIHWKDGLRALWAIVKFTLSDRLYVEDEYGSQIVARLSRAPRFNRWMADVIRPYLGERVLEIGAGIGNLTAHLLPRTAYWATDINRVYLDDLRKLCRSRPYLQTGFADVTHPETFPQGQHFDTAVCLNVVEHVEDDLRALRNIRDALDPGGRAIVLVPSGPWLFGSLDTVLGHHRRYTNEQLRSVAEQAGFRVQEILTFNRASVPAWWMNGKLLRRKTLGLFQIKILNLLVPLLRVLDSLLPLPPLSLIAVLQKPTENR